MLVVLAGGAGWLVTRADDTGWLFCIGVPVAVLGATFQAAAFASLEFAAGSEELRKAARNDPWFAKLRDEDGENDDEQRRFWEIVGEPAPAPSFVDLPYFGPGGQVLRSLGIGSAADLRAVTGRRAGRAELARQADVPLLVVGRWRRLAVLAAPRGARRSDVGTRDLELLLAVGISTRGQLLRRTRGGWQRGSLLKAVRDQARSRQIPPPRDNDCQAVARLGGMTSSACSGCRVSVPLSPGGAGGRGGACGRR